LSFNDVLVVVHVPAYVQETALLQSSMEAMRASTARMQSVLGDLNENADVLT
jgi:hypothetical protein